jgi:hypothetical protein
MYERLYEPLMSVKLHDNGRCKALYSIIIYHINHTITASGKAARTSHIITESVSNTTTGIDIEPPWQ